MQSNKESFWEQVRVAFALLFFGTFWGIKWLLKNRMKWLIDQLPHRAKVRKRQNREIKALEEQLGLKNEMKMLFGMILFIASILPMALMNVMMMIAFSALILICQKARYLEELREKVSKGWRDFEVVVSVGSKFYYSVPTFEGLPKIRYYVLVAVKVNSAFLLTVAERNEIF